MKTRDNMVRMRRERENLRREIIAGGYHLYLASELDDDDYDEDSAHFLRRLRAIEEVSGLERDV